MTSSTSIPLAPPPPISQEELFLKAYRRIRSSKTRPSTVAAQEFFASSNNASLTERLERLVQVLQEWVSNNETVGAYIG